MESVIGVLEGLSEVEKIEVHLKQGSNATGRLDLRLLSWGSGIGWYPQRTITLDCGEIDTLETILKRAKALIKTKEQQKSAAMGELVTFPLLGKKETALEERSLKQA